MKHRIFSGFFKWLLLIVLVVWALMTGITAAHPTLPFLSQLENDTAPVRRLIEDGTPLSFLQIQRQLALSGMSYLVSESPTLSITAWIQQLPRQLITSQLHALAASEEIPMQEFPEKVPEEDVALEEKTSSPLTPGINVHEFLKNHESTLPDRELLPLAQSEGPKKIVLYCTHNSESYTPSSGDTHVAGGHGLINDVAEHLAQQLTQKGLASEFVFAQHDWPSYDDSYTESRKTVNQILEEHPDGLLALFDVHRDSILSEKTADTVKINHRKAARILLVVGTNQRKPHPNWEQNLALAQKIETVGNQMYPGLIRGITQKAGTYHQELFTGALLLEFGTDLNSLEEAEYAAELLSDILAQVFASE